MSATAQDGQASPPSTGSRRHPCGGAGTIGSSRPRLQLQHGRPLCTWSPVSPAVPLPNLRAPVTTRHVSLFHPPTRAVLATDHASTSTFNPPDCAAISRPCPTFTPHSLSAARVGNTSDNCVIATGATRARPQTPGNTFARQEVGN